MSVNMEELQEPLQQLYNTYELISRNYSVRETGKAIVAPGPVAVVSQNYRNIAITEAPPYSKFIYRKMVERIDVVNSIIERAAELLIETLDEEAHPPSYLLTPKNNYAISDELEANILTVSRWMRYNEFRVKVYDLVYTAMWSGDAYAEIVFDKKDPWKIIEIKPIPPEDMRIIRDETGDVLGYIQYPFGNQFSNRNILNTTIAKKYLEAGGISFKPYEILHLRWNPFPSAAYGNSVLEPLKDLLAIIVGMREDIATIIKNLAAPLILFKLGTDLIPASDKALEKFRSNIIQQFNSSTNLITSSHVTAEVVAAGKNVMNMQPYFEDMMGMLYSSTGIAEIMLGGGSRVSDQGAKVRMEVTAKKIRKMQWYVKQQIELKIFPLLLDRLPDKRGVLKLTPEDMDVMPVLYFGPIETEEDKRIRIENGYQYGIYTREEARKQSGLRPIAKGTIIPSLDPDFIKSQNQAKMAKPAQANNGPNQQDNTDREKKGAKSLGKKNAANA